MTSSPALAVSQLYPILHTPSHPYSNLLSVVDTVSLRVLVPHQVPKRFQDPRFHALCNHCR